MEIDYFRNFITIVESGTLIAASDKIHITQPALSAQLKAMERHYHAQLLIRGSKNIELTEAGRILYESAKRMVDLEDAVEKDLYANIHGVQGTLRLGMTLSFPNPYIESLLYGFHLNRPQILFEIYENNSTELMERLRDGQIEVAILRVMGTQSQEFESVFAFQEPLCVKYRQDNPWSLPCSNELDISLLRDVPLAISRGVNAIFREECLRRGFEPKFMSVSSSRNQPIVWAKYGVAAAVVPSFVTPRNLYNGTLYTSTLSGSATTCSRVFTIKRGRKPSAVAQAFLDFCKENGYVDPLSGKFESLRTK